MSGGVRFVTVALVAAATLVAAVDNNQIPKYGFSCKGRPTGYYADVESGCQVYHMCDGLGRQFSYTCPNATLFQQRMLICDHWYMVNCSKSVDDYGANLRIGHKEMKFVDDSESNPYHRTPRPDLLSHHSQSEYDIIYRTGRAQYGTNLNLVGAESTKNRTTSTTDKPVYSLPSHWSTEYSRLSTTIKPTPNVGSTANFVNPKTINANSFNVGKSDSKVAVNFESSFKATTPVYPKRVDPDSSAIKSNVGSTVNFESSFKATTPVFPQMVDLGSSAINSNFGSTDDKVAVNFESSFKATTPVYPERVDADLFSPEQAGLVPPLPYQVAEVSVTTPVPVNFQSQFQATTPVYPTKVDITSEEPFDVGLLPPVGSNDSDTSANLQIIQVPTLSLEIEPPVYSAANNASETAEASHYHQPTNVESESVGESGQNRQGGFKALNNDEWKDLRKKFFIPDYEFPLETVSRPSYDSALSSFQARKK